MGVVYRAQDTRLKREVALKVLSPAFAQDAERLARFAREAQVLASLNHPGIAAVYGVEASALVLELVEGPTLAESSGAMAWGEALPVIQQLVDAIEYAHEKGVIHRDLKPANIKLTAEGRVKVLDFGLAKALANEPGGTSTNPADSPTLTMALGTVAGMIMGTAAYMAPEQARGKAVDKRADIWAFGVVVYELLTGTRLFRGETVSDILAQTLTKEVDFAPVPVQAQKLLRRCLDRDPRTRLRDIGEARPLLLAEPAPQVAPKPPRLPWMLVAAGALLLGAGAGYLLRPAAKSSAPLLRFEVAPLEMSPRGEARISPDGKHLAYVAANKLWLREMATGRARAIEGTDDVSYLYWAPDSTMIGFNARSKVWKVGLGGDAPLALAQVSRVHVGCFSPDGKTILVYVGKVGFVAIPIEGGRTRVLWKDVSFTAAGSGLASTSVLPAEGPMRWVLSSSGTTIVLIDLETGKLEDIGAGSNPVYSPTGHLLFENSAGRLQAAPFSLRDRKFTAAPIDLANDSLAVSISQNGMLAFSGRGSDQTRLMIRDRQGKELGGAGAPQSRMAGIAISPNGRQIAVASTEQGSADIWLHELDRAVKTRLTTSDKVESRPQWSPDGKEILYSGDGRMEIVPADGSRPPAAPNGAAKADAVSDWSPDGSTILHWLILPSNVTSYSRRTPAGERWETTPYLTGPFDQSFGKFSRDGRFVAYVSNESGDEEIYVRPFPGGSGKWRISPKGGVQVRWSRSGKELFYLEQGVLMAVPFSVANGVFAAGTPKPLFPTGDYMTGRTNGKYDELPNGRFVVIERTAEALAEARVVHVIQNWPALLERKAGSE